MVTTQVSRGLDQAPLLREVWQLDRFTPTPVNWPTTDLPGGTLRLDGRWIRDPHGRALMLRGFNLSADAKIPPHLPIPDEHHLDRLASWGMNCIRLVHVWEALEPRRGYYDEVHLSKMVDLVQAAWRRGIYTIIDMHQDLFSRALGGSGAPIWAHPPPRNPDRSIGNRWYGHYVHNAEVAWAFERFWDNADFIRDSFVQLWSKLAQRFANVDGVLGYDLLNEPAARFFPDTLLGRLDRDILPDFYYQVAQAVRAADPYRLILVQASPLTGLGIPSALGQPNGRPPLHDLGGLVYAPHIYDGLAVFFGRFKGNPWAIRHTLSIHLKTAARLRAGLIVGEFGVLNNLRGAHDLYAAKLRLFDRYLVNWIAWTYAVSETHWNGEDISVIFPDGRERAQVDLLVRPYPHATAGTPLGLSFDPRSRAFIYTYSAAPEIQKPTEVYLPRRHYPHGFDLRLSRGLTAEYDDQRQVLLLRHAPGVAQCALGVYAK